MPQDISNMLNGTGVELEKNAFDRFGAAVDSGEDRLSFGSPMGEPVSQQLDESSVWNSSDYASMLVKTNQVPFNPKLKFMFKVSFKFAPEIVEAAEAMGYPTRELQENFSFLVRHVDRPKHDFDYEEVNMYNFRTKVLKSIRHREVSLTVYDDVGNTALTFVNLYRKMLQPIAREKDLMPSLAHEDFGFAFGMGMDTSLRAALPGNAKNVLSEMTIHQIFVERGSDVGNPSAWVKVVNFTFMNPRFTNIDIDDLDHENGGNFNIITFSVDFDSVFMDEPRAFTSETGGPSFSGGDIPSDGKGGTSSQGGNPAARTAREQVSGRGYGEFDYTGLSDGGATDVEETLKMGGLLQEQGAKSVRGMMDGSRLAFARPISPALIDNTSAPSITELMSEQEFSDDGDFV